MEVFCSVRNEVMAPVMSRPPERAFLIRRRSRKRNQELENSAGAVSAVCQQTMKAGSNCKHSHHVQSQTGNHSHYAYACPDDKQTRNMHEEELHADEIIQFVVVEGTNVD
jgi:hypothetical protein